VVKSPILRRKTHFALCPLRRALYLSRMEVQVAVLCDSASDYRSKLCILGAFDTISATQLPATHPHCSIALRLIFRDQDEGEHTMRLRLIDEDGKNMLPTIEPRLHVKLPPEMFFFSRNLIFNLQQITFHKPGQYSIDILFNDQMIARIPLQVVLRGENRPA
jgi:hypothetical protein